jgi:hypothetical protein
MVRIPRTGVSFATIHERFPEFDRLVDAGLVDPRQATTTLAEVIADLGFVPLSVEDEQRVRDELGRIVGRAWDEVGWSQKQSPDGRLLVADVQASLLRTAKWLDDLDNLDAGQLNTVEEILHGAKTGRQHVHNITLPIRSFGRWLKN